MLRLSEAKPMWILLGIALIVLCLMAIGGSSGARTFLGIMLVLVVIFAVYLYSENQKEARQEAARRAREVACHAPVLSECLYREISDRRTRITAAIAALQADFTWTDPARAKTTVDQVVGEQGYVTVSDDNLRRLLIYRLRPKCAGEKSFHFQVEFEYASGDAGIARVGTWWQGAEKDASYRSWESCVTRPENAGHEGYDAQLSFDYSKLSRRPPPEAVRGVLPGSSRRVQASSQLSDDDDPCAVGISARERLTRLRKYGPVRQTGARSYSAAGHSLAITYDGTSIVYCH
jgi:hypothetical protein